MYIMEIYNDIGTVDDMVLFIQFDGSLLQFFMQLGESLVLDGSK